MMLSRRTLRTLAVLFVAALVISSTALAKPKKHKKKPPNNTPTTYVWQGSFQGTVPDTVSTTMHVDSGNVFVQRQDMFDSDVAFDFTGASVQVGDTNLDGVSNLSDVMFGDQVMVLSKRPRLDPGEMPIPAQQLVDLSR
jgi:hypothetical protein